MTAFLRDCHPRFPNSLCFNKDEVVSLTPQPPTWRTRVPFLVWSIAFDPAGMGGPTGNICYRRHGSQVHLGTQAPPLRQSRDTSWGHTVISPSFSTLIHFSIFQGLFNSLRAKFLLSPYICLTYNVLHIKQVHPSWVNKTKLSNTTHKSISACYCSVLYANFKMNYTSDTGVLV
jgi:hypothetical protein